MPDTTDQLVSDVIAITGASSPRVLDDDAPILTATDAPTYLIGLIGGKDVGKSSLVNALVAQSISEQSSHGRGTEDVVAYVHESKVKEIRELLDREVPGRFRVHPHRIESLARQVLVDLPDIDSIYSDHVQITRKMLRHMLYPIWIQSVEKYADQTPQKLLARVSEGNDPANFIFCLNKADQIAGKDGPAAVTQIRDDFAARIARTLNLPDAPEVYVISARSPGEFDFPALRSALAQQRSEQTVRDAKQLAGRQQSRTILGWLDAQRLPERSDRIARLREDASEAIATRLGVPILEDALPQLVNDPAYRLAIIDPVVAARMSHWPIVNIVHGVLSPFFAIIRRNVGASTSSEPSIDAYLSSDGKNLSTMVQTTFAQLQQSNPTISTLYRDNKLWESATSEFAAAGLQRRLQETLLRQREAALDRVGRRAGFFTAIFAPLLTIGAILWFPIVQPALEILLQPNIAHLSRELALRIVQLLGTTFLLKNLTFLLLWFVVLWAIVRARTHRRVSRLIARWQSDPNLDPSLSFAGQTLEWIDELLAPIDQHQQRIDDLVARIEQLREQSKTRSAA